MDDVSDHIGGNGMACTSECRGAGSWGTVCEGTDSVAVSIFDIGGCVHKKRSAGVKGEKRSGSGIAVFTVWRLSGWCTIAAWNAKKRLFDSRGRTLDAVRVYGMRPWFFIGDGLQPDAAACGILDAAVRESAESGGRCTAAAKYVTGFHDRRTADGRTSVDGSGGKCCRCYATDMRHDSGSSGSTGDL